MSEISIELMLSEISIVVPVHVAFGTFWNCEMPMLSEISMEHRDVVVDADIE